MTEPEKGTNDKGAGQSTAETRSGDRRASRGETFVIVGLLIVSACVGLYLLVSDKGGPRPDSRPRGAGSRVAAASTAPLGQPNAPGSGGPGVVPVGASGAPSGSPPLSGVPFTELIDLGTVPPRTVFKALVEMQKSDRNRLTPDQSQRITSLLQSLMRVGKERPDVAFLDGAAGVLKPDQITVALAQTMGSTGIASDPLASGLAFLEKTAGNASPATHGARDARAAKLAPWMVMKAVPHLEKDAALTAAQAAALLPQARALVHARDQTVKDLREIMGVFRPGQREVMEQVLKSDPKTQARVDDALEAVASSAGGEASGAPSPGSGSR